MKAMLLAAGRGKRLGRLTVNTPKPLIKVQEKALIEYHLEALVRAGIKEIIINVSYLAKQIIQALGDGSRYGAAIRYSFEPQEGGLETGGGIFQALPLLGDQPFAVINSDIWTDYPFEQLPSQITGLAHVVLVPNPDFHLQGDFHLQHHQVFNHGEPNYTFAGITVYHPHFFQNCQPGRYSVTPLLRQMADQGQLSGELYQGLWSDLGTEERLSAIRMMAESPDEPY